MAARSGSSFGRLMRGLNWRPGWASHSRTVPGQNPKLLLFFKAERFEWRSKENPHANRFSGKNRGDPRSSNCRNGDLPWDEILLATLVGVLCGADDFAAIELLSREYLAWLKQFLPYKAGIPRAQTFRKVFRLLKPEVLERCLGAWVASLQDIVRGVVAVDGKTPRGSKKAADGSGALHLLSAYACEAGLVIGQRAVNGKSNEIKAIPEHLEMLALNGAIASIDAMGTQKAIAGKIVEQKADYVLALKGNQSSLHEDVKLFFEDAELANTCAVHKTASAGQDRIEERECRVADAASWLQERHKGWQKLSSVAAIASTRIAKKPAGPLTKHAST
ncbi:MAG: ISAs1 family transposase [Methylocella sp.]